MKKASENRRHGVRSKPQKAVKMLEVELQQELINSYHFWEYNVKGFLTEKPEYQRKQDPEKKMVTILMLMVIGSWQMMRGPSLRRSRRIPARGCPRHQRA